jgi:hypothetical protein
MRVWTLFISWYVMHLGAKIPYYLNVQVCSMLNWDQGAKATASSIL